MTRECILACSSFEFYYILAHLARTGCKKGHWIEFASHPTCTGAPCTMPLHQQKCTLGVVRGVASEEASACIALITSLVRTRSEDASTPLPATRALENELEKSRAVGVSEFTRTCPKAAMELRGGQKDPAFVMIACLLLGIPPPPPPPPAAAPPLRPSCPSPPGASFCQISAKRCTWLCIMLMRLSDLASISSIRCIIHAV